MTTQDACLPCGTRGRARAATPGYRTCLACSDGIRDNLAGIRDGWMRLDVTFRPFAGSEPARSVPHSTSPANDHIIAIMDPRSTWNGTVYSPPAVLGSWVQMVAEDTGQDIGDTTVPGLVRWLAGMHAHITRQLWVDDYAVELAELHSAVRGASGAAKARPIAPCPVIVGDGARCGTTLWLPPPDDRGIYRTEVISCPADRSHRWDRPRWELLSRMISEAAVKKVAA